MDKLSDMYHLLFIRPCEPPSLYRSYLSDGILVVKKYKGPTSLPSIHPSRPSFETKKEMMKDMLREGDEPPQSHAQAKKNVSHVCTLQATNILIQQFPKALIRDDFCCIASGNYDPYSAVKNHELMHEVDKSDSKMGNTQCAHIFLQLTNMDISGSREDSSKVRSHVLLYLGHRQLLAPSSIMPRLYGLF